MSKKLRIRPWQNECLAKAMHCLRSTVSREFLIDAAPGAGKTICALLIAKVLLDNPRFNNIIYEKIFLPNSSEIVERLNKNDEFEIILKNKQ